MCRVIADPLCVVCMSLRVCASLQRLHSDHPDSPEPGCAATSDPSPGTSYGMHSRHTRALMAASRPHSLSHRMCASVFLLLFSRWPHFPPSQRPSRSDEQPLPSSPPNGVCLTQGSGRTAAVPRVPLAECRECAVCVSPEARLHTMRELLL